jgi:hypothetical protein
VDDVRIAAYRERKTMTCIGFTLRSRREPESRRADQPHRKLDIADPRRNTSEPSSRGRVRTQQSQRLALLMSVVTVV